MHNEFTDEEKAELVTRRLLGQNTVQDIAGRFGNFDSREAKIPAGFRLMEFTKENHIHYLKRVCDRKKLKYIKCLKWFEKKKDGSEWHPLYSGLILTLENWISLRAWLIKQNRYVDENQKQLLI